ncbi:poly adp-ribose polymerase member 14-like protein [Stylonychia lemnae]|uniref:Poly [ADP-ribose] polymerase n=1 Tax=Stylonychia lemnae TaxID=5949 RepID=A0A078AHX2_STYLE|nr:poly adp-ribose polymerase member 14-like protein [Stylonychia lemnae]|eukprot:CDW81865.1 poly adp-ribose polymerase member 14-like protein [Stylonychia lemnae]
MWEFLISNNYEVFGVDQFKQRFIEDLRDEVVQLNRIGKNASQSMQYLRNSFNGLALILEWYEWHSNTGKGFKYSQKPVKLNSKASNDSLPNQFLKNLSNLQIQAPSESEQDNQDKGNPAKFLEEEKEIKIQNGKLDKIYTINQSYVRFQYIGLATIQGPIDDKFKIQDMPDLFYIQDNNIKYLCFGGDKHALINHHYQKYLTSKQYFDFSLQTQVKVTILKQQNEIQSNFYFCIEQDKLRVIIVEQLDHDRDNSIYIDIQIPQSRQPELEIEVLGPRQWQYFINDEFHELILIQDESFNPILNEIYDNCKQQNADQTLWIIRGDRKQLYGCIAPECKPFAVDPFTKNVFTYSFIQDKYMEYWHLIKTFKFPKNLDEKYTQINDFTCTEILDEDSLEFQYTAFKFLKTYTGRDQRLDEVQGTVQIMNQEISQVDLSSIKEIKKIYNKQIYQTIKSELKRIMKKHPQMFGLNLIKHLFHGTRQTDPKDIYSFESGLDMRYGNDGANGVGLYFADNSQYSAQYSYKNNQDKQIFMCTVITGLSSTLGGGQGARLPAAIPGKQGALYDSFNNGNGGHYVIYDNQKSYPGYLITF